MEKALRAPFSMVSNWTVGKTISIVSVLFRIHWIFVSGYWVFGFCVHLNIAGHLDLSNSASADSANLGKKLIPVAASTASTVTTNSGI